MKPDFDIFNTIVKHAPLVSIDMIVINLEGNVLLGWRKNAPAKNFWFVPGGRILKDETIEHAFGRISKAELGTELNLKDSRFLGVYEHIYPDDNFAEINTFSTHYVVLAFKINLDEQIIFFPEEQHAKYKWASPGDILMDPKTHQNVKNYFNGFKPF